MPFGGPGVAFGGPETPFSRRKQQNRNNVKTEWAGTLFWEAFFESLTVLGGSRPDFRTP
jgi:hypothetical protein